MNAGFVEYLRGLDMSAPLIERVEAIHDLYQVLVPGDYDQVFVSEVVEKSGSREYLNLWFFTDEYMMEAHDFVTEDDLDAGTYPFLDLVRATSHEYDYLEASPESRLTVKFSASFVGGTLQASGANCDRLFEVLTKWFMPRLSSD